MIVQYSYICTYSCMHLNCKYVRLLCKAVTNSEIITFPSIVPFSRIFFVKARVSIPVNNEFVNWARLSDSVSGTQLEIVKISTAYETKSAKQDYKFKTSYCGNVALFQPCVQRLYCTPMAIDVRAVTDYQSSCMNFIRFKPSIKSKFVICSGRNSYKK